MCPASQPHTDGHQPLSQTVLARVTAVAEVLCCCYCRCCFRCVSSRSGSRRSVRRKLSDVRSSWRRRRLSALHRPNSRWSRRYTSCRWAAWRVHVTAHNTASSLQDTLWRAAHAVPANKAACCTLQSSVVIVPVAGAVAHSLFPPVERLHVCVLQVAALAPKIEAMEASWNRLRAISGAETPNEVVEYWQGGQSMSHKHGRQILSSAIVQVHQCSHR
jgi:hypothetical protein